MVDLSVIIVNWNSIRVLQDCLASLAGVQDITLETWVVDNASQDDSVSFLREHFPWVRLLVNAENRGFAAANNQAAAAAHGRYLLLLNPDTEIRPNALSQLVHTADSHPNLGALGPRLLNSDGSLQRSCWRGYPGLRAAFVDAFYLWKMPWMLFARTTEYTPLELNALRAVDHLLGACMLIPRAVWQQVGPLDEQFFLFLEETDWCLRARQAGFEILYDPAAEVVHHGQHSMHQQPARNLPHLYRSYCRFYRKHYPQQRLGLYLLKLIIGMAVTLRLGLWQARSLGANSAESRHHARLMSHGYWQVLRQLTTL